MSPLHSLTLKKVDFDVLYVILFTFWSNFIMCDCVDGGHFGFLAVENFAGGGRVWGLRTANYT